MSWFDYTPLGAIDSLTGNHLEKAGKKVWGDLTEEGGILGDPTGTGARQVQGEKAGGFADRSEGEFAYLGGQAGNQRQYMEDIARGRESVSAMQLQQALGQNQAQQQSMAAGARPGNAAMAARGAAMNAGRQGAGLAGQQAMAGIQERQAAQNALNEMLLKQRQQELQGALGSRQNAVSAYNPSGASGAEKQGGAIQAGLSYLGLG